jgi:hypothetical protein
MLFNSSDVFVFAEKNTNCHVDVGYSVSLRSLVC